MPETPKASDKKGYACFPCRSKKIRCCQQDPCSHCVKSGRPCNFIPPTRGKRKKKAPKEGLHAKIRRYEALLASYGAKVEPTSDDASSGSESEHEQNTQKMENERLRNTNSKVTPLFNTKGPVKLIAKNGASRYFDSGVWSSIGDEFQHPSEVTFNESVERAETNASHLFSDGTDEHDLVLGSLLRFQPLTNLHPPLMMVEKMFGVFKDRVECWAKILHLPTFHDSLLTALQSPHKISKSLEALIFSFYFITVTSLDDEETLRILGGESKPILSQRYRLATRQALVNAEFLKTTSLVTLQAYVLFLLSMKNNYQIDSHFILSGICIRLARRMGMHRDGESLGLTVFETELRRRLWCHIVAVDCRIAEFSGTRPSQDVLLSDSKPPLNVEDEDFGPNTQNPPPECVGITKMAQSMIRSEVMTFLRELSTQATPDFHWSNLRTANMPVERKEDLINAFESHLESKYIRYCDISIPHHFLASIMCRSSIAKMRLMAHNPRQFSDIGVKVPQRSRDVIFTMATKLLEYVNLLRQNEYLRNFSWHAGSGFLWDLMLYIFIECRDRAIGPEVERAWTLLEDVFSSYPEIFSDAPDALCVAIGNWALQVWDECSAARKASGIVDQSTTPAFVTTLRNRKESRMILDINSTATKTDMSDYSPTTAVENDINMTYEYPAADTYDFSNLLSFDLDPDEWKQWDRLLVGQSF